MTTVSSGHTSSFLTLNSGDVLSVLNDGSAFSTTVNSDGLLLVFAGGTASATVVNAGGTEVVSSGGKDVSATVASGGDEQFDVGATLSHLSLTVGASLTEVGLTLGEPGASITIEALSQGITIDSVGVGGTTLDVVAAISLTVMSGATQFVSSGGATTGTTVSSGGFAIVNSAGVANATTVEPFAEQLVEGGRTSGTLINGSGAYEYVYAGAATTGSLVHNGGQEMISRGATATAARVDSGSFMSVFSGGAALTTNVGSGGELVVASAGSATDTMLSGGALLVRSGGSALSAITFAGSGDLLAVVEPVSSAVGNAVSATLSGLGAGDTIDLSGITYVSPGASAGIVGDVLTVSDGGKAYSFQLDAGQNYVGYQFQIGASTDDGPFGPGTDVAVLCFRPGTRIATPFGTAPVETLRPGDLVLTASGQAEPVCRLGVQTVSLRFADPLRALPIRVRAGALAERVPSRDLLVSPGHALLIDGVLAQAGALVNGSSVVREAVMPEIFRYYHLELAAHAVLLAEDTPAESYLDGVEAMAFDDAGAREAAAPAEQLPYPRIKAQRQLPQAVRARLMARAALLAARPAA